jgi:thiamine biosynthesis protein ThiS
MNIDGKIAVEINREILPRSRFEDCHIKNGDVLEIVQAIGGG